MEFVFTNHLGHLWNFENLDIQTYISYAKTLTEF